MKPCKYFRGSWDDPFNRQLTQEGPFGVSKNEERPVQMMHNQSTFTTTCTGEIVTKLLRPPHAHRERNRTIMLPDQSVGLETVGKEVTSEKLTECTRPEVTGEEEATSFLP